MHPTDCQIPDLAVLLAPPDVLIQERYKDAADARRRMARDCCAPYRVLYGVVKPVIVNCS